MVKDITDEQRQEFDQDGFIVLRSAIDLNLIQAAAAAIDRILDRAENNEFGDQFNWVDKDQRVPAFINDLLTLEKYDPAFGQVLEQSLLPLAEGLLERPIRLSWLLLLTGGAGQHYEVCLHRDNNELGGEEEELLLEQYRMKGVYFQAPLLPDDSFLQMVPGSHSRMATDKEVSVATSNVASTDVPDLVTIDLQPGDVIFRQTNTIHQGWNPKGLPRRTLVSSLWANELPIQPIENPVHERERLRPEFVDQLPPLCRTATRRYLDHFASPPAESQVVSR